MADLLHASARAPTVVTERRMALGPIVAARTECVPRPNWTAIFLKAFALTATRIPELRRFYLSIPWPRLYEHPKSTGMFTVARRDGDEQIVVFGHRHHPERRSLAELSDYMRRCQEGPLEEVGLYRRLRSLARWPWFIRRFLWWLGMNLSGYLRARNFGTFAVTSIASLGAGALHVLAPTPSTLFYGLFDTEGNLDVRLQLDHRVYDGFTAARTLVELEQTLLTEIHSELRGIQKKQAA